jgi:hypothetical protein
MEAKAIETVPLPCMALISREGRPKNRPLRAQQMDRHAVPSNDTPFVLMTPAYDAMHHQSVELHYRSCGSGVGR